MSFWDKTKDMTRKLKSEFDKRNKDYQEAKKRAQEMDDKKLKSEAIRKGGIYKSEYLKRKYAEKDLEETEKTIKAK